MSNMNILPYETLSRIFQGLTRHDLIQCQKVCRTWRVPARDVFLKKIHLRKNVNIIKLLSTIDDNPTYLNNVKQLVLGTAASISVPQAERLFSVITGGIKEIQIQADDSLMSLSKTTTLCKTVCSKITVTPFVPHETYCTLIEPLCQSLTSVCWKNGATLEFFSNFSQLQEIDISATRNLNTFEKWLPLFEQHDYLKSIQGYLTIDDAEDSLNRYMLMKSDKERNMILGKLSNLETLFVQNYEFFPNTIKIITKYLIGLQQFRFHQRISKNWTQNQLDVFSNEFLNFLNNMVNYYVELRMDRPALSRCLTTIFHKVFDQLPQSTHCPRRILKIHLIPYDNNKIAMKSMKTSPYSQLERSVDLKITMDEHETIVQHVKESQAQVNALYFRANSGDIPSTYFSMMQELLDVLPSITKISFAVPQNRGKKFYHKNGACQYTQVKYLELSTYETKGRRRHFSFEQVKRKHIWNDCISMFPEIKFLKLKYFTGVWKSDLREYNISLKNVELERLHLDVTPVFKKLYYVTFNLDFVLDIQTYDERHFYKISVNSLETTKIDGAMAEDSFKKGSIRVRIQVADLQFINLYLFKCSLRDNMGRVYYYLDNYMDLVKEAKISLV